VKINLYTLTVISGIKQSTMTIKYGSGTSKTSGAMPFGYCALRLLIAILQLGFISARPARVGRNHYCAAMLEPNHKVQIQL
jgi:hypothetical protein